MSVSNGNHSKVFVAYPLTNMDLLFNRVINPVADQRIIALRRLAEISKHEVKAAPVDKNLPAIMQDVLNKRHSDEFQQELSDGTDFAIKLLSYADADIVDIEKKMKECRQFLRDSKKRILRIKETKASGNATANYIPLASLYISQEKLKVAGVTDDLL